MNKRALIYVNIAVLLFGFAGLFGKWIELPSVGVTFGRVFFSSIALGLFMLITRQSFRLDNLSDVLTMIAGGFIMGIHWWSIFESIKLSSVAIGTITFSTFPLFLTFLEPLVYRQKIKRRNVIMAVIIIIGVILSVSILALYVSNPTFLSNRIIMLIGAYCIIILPYIYQGIRNGMRAVNMPVLLEAAEMLGASRIYAFFRVIVPNIISAIVVSSLLAVGIIFGDYVLVRNLASSAWPNVQIYLYQAMKSDSMKSSAVFVVIMAVTFLIAAIVLYLQSREKKGKK